MSAVTVVPAHLSYLAIYNPTLGPTDETVGDQIVFYYSHRLASKLERQSEDTHLRASKNETTSEHDSADSREKEAEENERLRQVGLAQGIVNFVK